MLALCISFSIALFDQVSKYAARNHLPSGPVTVVPQFFDLRYVQNTGAAWGMLEGLNDWLVILSLVMLALILVFHRSILVDTLVHRIATGLMIGGIVGNLLDRVRLGYVVDFLDFHWGIHHFPAFNVADASICTGVGLYILTQLLRRPDPGGSPSESGAQAPEPGDRAA
jgi:signal peptidase II